MRRPDRDDADLYVDIIARGATDWLEVREAASRFTWLAYNENIAFRWKEPQLSVRRDVQSENPYLLPDAMMETSDRRFLIELERPTKPLGAAFRKIDQYNRLLHPSQGSEDTDAAAREPIDPDIDLRPAGLGRGRDRGRNEATTLAAISVGGERKTFFRI